MFDKEQGNPEEKIMTSEYADAQIFSVYQRCGFLTRDIVVSEITDVHRIMFHTIAGILMDLAIAVEQLREESKKR